MSVLHPAVLFYPVLVSILMQPKRWPAPRIAAGYFSVHITALRREWHKVWLSPNHL